MATIYISGDGTSKDPLRPGRRVREIIRALIRSPRASMKDVHEALKREGMRDAFGITNSMLGNGPLGDALRFRVSLAGRRTEGGACTCLLRVHLNGKEKWKGLDEIVAVLNRTPGVIEWDEITGTEIDFLVRIADINTGPLTTHISRELEALPAVFNVTSLHIRRSGIVDNFEPEQFLCFDGD